MSNSENKSKSVDLSQSPQSSQRKIKKLCVLSGLCEIFKLNFHMRYGVQGRIGRRHLVSRLLTLAFSIIIYHFLQFISQHIDVHAQMIQLFRK